jgi:hypothetical protein
MFPPPHRAKLVTVPSCAACNRGFAKDDEYFRQSMVMRREVALDPKWTTVLDSVTRAWQRPQGRGLTARTAASFRDVEIKTPAGIRLGTAPAYIVDKERLTATLARFTRGLFYRERSYRLPDDCRVTVHLGTESAPDILAEALSWLADRPVTTIGAGVLSYKWVQASDNELATVWLMVFYERTPFITLTLPPSQGVTRRDLEAASNVL